MRRVIPLLLRLVRAIILPRRAAVLAELRASRMLRDMGDQLASHQSERAELQRDIRDAKDDAAYWRVEAGERQRESEASILAHKLCREELGAARVQIDATAKIIHALNEQRMMDARIAATRAQGPPSNADILGRVTD